MKKIILILLTLALFACIYAQAANTDAIYKQLLKAIDTNDSRTFDKYISQIPDIDTFLEVDNEYNGYTLLGYACKLDRVNFAEKLINRDADMYSAETDEFLVYNALFVAVHSEALSVVSLLLRKGADPNSMNTEERLSHLSIACRSGNYDIAKLLIENGALVDGLGENEWTDYSFYPLIDAVASENIRLVQLLLDNGATVNVKDREGFTPLSLAEQSGNVEISNLLASHIAKEKAKQDAQQAQAAQGPDLSDYDEVSSSDGKLKVYSRDNGQGGSWVWYDNYLRFESNDKITSFEGPLYKYLNPNDDDEGERGTYYDKIDTIKGGGKTYYLVHSINKLQGGNYSFSLGAYTIDDRLKPVDLFEKGKEKKSGFSAEVWWSDMECLFYYEKAGNAFYVPITEETGEMQISVVRYEKYKWMGEHFRYVENAGTRFWLHSSLQEYVGNVAECETARLHIRIDEMGENNYRYASWQKGKPTTETPTLVIQNGKYVSGKGNAQYAFEYNDFTYSVVFEQANSGYLAIYRDGKEILRENISQ